MAEPVTVIVEVENGEVKVIADGSKLSCDTAHDVERALGEVTKSVPTAKKAVSGKLVQR